MSKKRCCGGNIGSPASILSMATRDGAPPCTPVTTEILNEHFNAFGGWTLTNQSTQSVFDIFSGALQANLSFANLEGIWLPLSIDGTKDVTISVDVHRDDFTTTPSVFLEIGTIDNRAVDISLQPFGPGDEFLTDKNVTVTFPAGTIPPGSTTYADIFGVPAMQGVMFCFLGVTDFATYSYDNLVISQTVCN